MSSLLYFEPQSYLILVSKQPDVRIFKIVSNMHEHFYLGPYLNQFYMES